MGIQAAVRAKQLALRGGQLSATVHHVCHGLNPFHTQRYRPDQLKVELGGRITPTSRQHGVHGTAQGRVQNCGVPAAMDRAHGVQMGALGAALKDHLTQAGMDNAKIQLHCHGRRWGAALEHARDGFQASLPVPNLPGLQRWWVRVGSGFFFQVEPILQYRLGCLGVQFFRLLWVHHRVNSSSLELRPPPLLHGQPPFSKIGAALAHGLARLNGV